MGTTTTTLAPAAGFVRAQPARPCSGHHTSTRQLDPAPSIVRAPLRAASASQPATPPPAPEPTMAAVDPRTKRAMWDLFPRAMAAAGAGGAAAAAAR